MRIKRLDIYGYGKWVDESFDIAEDVQLFHGMNEAGKSTLMSFIHSVLFGFPTRSSVLLRYEPNESSKYGGKIIVEDKRFGECVIERVHGKVTGNVTVTLEDGTTGADELLDTLLSGMTRETFQNIFSFSLTDIENVHQLNKEELSRYLLNIGAHGTDYYLDKVDELGKEADRIYRPSGRVLPLNKQISALEKQEKRLSDLEARNESYLGLLEEHARQADEIEQLEKRRARLEDKLSELLEMKKEWHVFEEIKTLSREIQQIKLPPLKEDGKYLFEEYKKDLSKINEELQEIHLALNAQKERLKHSDKLDHYEKHEAEILQLEQGLPEIVEQLGEFQSIANQRAETQKQLTSLELQLKLGESASYPKAIIESDQEILHEWQKSAADLTDKLEAIEKKIEVLSNDWNQKNQNLDQIESVMWDNTQFKEVEEELKSGRKADKEPTKEVPFFALLTGGFGAILFGVSFLFNPPIQWFVLIMGLANLILSVVFFNQRPKIKETDTKSQDFMTAEYEKQQSLREQFKVGLSESDMIQQKLHEETLIRDSYKTQQEGIQENWVAFLREHHLPITLELNQAEAVIQHTNDLHELLEKDKDSLEKQTQLQKVLAKETEPISAILSLDDQTPFSEKIRQFRMYLREVNAVLEAQKDQISKLTTLRQEEKQLNTNKENTKNKMQTLIETAGAKDEEDFFNLYSKKEDRDKKKSRLRFLKENTPSFNEADDLPTKEELAERETRVREELKKASDENKKWVMELANSQLSIENLERDGTYTEALQEFENQKASTQKLVDEWVSNKIAAGMIQETLNQVTKERFEEIIFDAENYFHLLTDGEYEKIVFKEEELFVQHRRGQVVDVKVLSRGTSEPLYVAIRLAYIKNTQDMIELPIIMDDPFVNFDRTRQKNMYRLMQQFGEDAQIIYFTFDPDARGYFESHQMTNLNER